MFKQLASALMLLATTTSGFAFEILGDSASVDMRVTSIISHETGSTITASGPVEGYGKVWVTLELTSSDSNRNQGVLGGQGRALLDDGSMVGSPFMGNWSRADTLSPSSSWITSRTGRRTSSSGHSTSTRRRLRESTIQ